MNTSNKKNPHIVSFSIFIYPFFYLLINHIQKNSSSWCFLLVSSLHVLSFILLFSVRMFLYTSPPFSIHIPSKMDTNYRWRLCVYRRREKENIEALYDIEPHAHPLLVWRAARLFTNWWGTLSEMSCLQRHRRLNPWLNPQRCFNFFVSLHFSASSIKSRR